MSEEEKVVQIPKKGVTVTVGQLLALAPSREVPGPLQELLKVKVFSVRVTYKLARLVKLLEPEIQTALDRRNELLKEYGEEDGKGGLGINQESPKWKEFAPKFTELTEVEQVVDVEPVELPPDATGVSGATLVALDGLVKVRGE